MNENNEIKNIKITNAQDFRITFTDGLNFGLGLVVGISLISFIIWLFIFCGIKILIALD